MESGGLINVGNVNVVGDICDSFILLHYLVLVLYPRSGTLPCSGTVPSFWYFQID